MIGAVCVATAYMDYRKEMAAEPKQIKKLPGDRIMLQDGSIVKVFKDGTILREEELVSSRKTQ